MGVRFAVIHKEGILKRSLLIFAFVAALSGWWVADGLAEESKLQFGGDLRGRWEGFWYDTDATGSKKEGRRRLRYRLRLNLSATLNDHAKLAIRVGTGDKDSRSGNESIGAPVDFGPNELDVRRAYLIIMPFADGTLPNHDGHWAFQFGRVANPFLWKNGKDIMLWDGDINPGGVSTTFDIAAGEKAIVFANLGGFVIAENKSDRDPYVAAIQGGVELKLSDNAKAGVRGTWYYFDNLDADFIARGVDGTGGVTSGGGNIEDGLTGDPLGGDMTVVEVQGYVTAGIWPVVAFGGFSSNLSAEVSLVSPTVEEENTAFNIGIEAGNKKKVVSVGGGYYHVRANAFPSQLIDSDLLDGRTNRTGFMAYGAKQILEGTDLKATLLWSDAIEEGAGFQNSVADAKRFRAQLDLIYEF